MTGLLRRWAGRLMGPVGWRLLLGLALAAAWLAWPVLPPRPLREWATTSRQPRDWFLTSDRTCLACLTDPPLSSGCIAPDFKFGPMRLWDLTTGRERLTAGTGRQEVYTVILRVAADGSWLLQTRYGEGSAEALLQLWDTESGRERWSRNDVDGHWPGGPVKNQAVSPDSRLVAYRRRDGTSCVLSIASGQVLFALGDDRPLAFAPDSQTLATVDAGADPNPPAAVTVWDMANGRPRAKLKLKQRFGVYWSGGIAAAFSPDGRWLAVAVWAETDPAHTPKVVELWDLQTGERAAELDLGTTWDPHYCGLEFGPDGSWLVSPALFRPPLAWDVRQLPPRAMDVSGTPVIRFFEGISIPSNGPAYPIFAPGGARFVGVTPESGGLAFRETGTPERRAVAHQDVWLIDRPKFAPDGRTLVILHPAPFLNPWKQAVNWLYQTARRPPPYTAERRLELEFFDMATGAVCGRMSLFSGETHLIGFGPDGRTVWMFTYTLDPPAESRPLPGAGVLRVQEWAVPSPWPPVWLLAATALGVLLAVADWRRTRWPAPGGPTP